MTFFADGAFRVGLGRTWLIVLAGLLSVAALIVYSTVSSPVGVEPKSGNSEIIAWIALATAVVTLLTAIVGLIEKLIDRRKPRTD